MCNSQFFRSNFKNYILVCWDSCNVNYATEQRPEVNPVVSLVPSVFRKRNGRLCVLSLLETRVDIDTILEFFQTKKILTKRFSFTTKWVKMEEKKQLLLFHQLRSLSAPGKKCRFKVEDEKNGIENSWNSSHAINTYCLRNIFVVSCVIDT